MSDLSAPLIWQDGQSPLGYSVTTVEIQHDRLILRGSTLPTLPDWPVANLLVQDIPPNTLILACKNQPGRLVATGAGAVQVRAVLAQSGIWRSTRTHRRNRLAAGLGATLAALVGIWFAWPPIADRLVSLIPTSADTAIGSALRPVLLGDERACTAPAGRVALARIMARLEPHTQAPVPLNISVVDSPIVNAIAMPGGTIVVFRGLIDRADSPDEVAGVLAHEIGHQHYRHSMRGLMRHAGAALVISLLDPSGGVLGSLAGHLSQTAHGRSFEAQADGYAVQTLNAAGISTRGLADFFTRMQGEHGDTTGLWRYALTHPPLADRITSIPLTDAPPVLSADEWKALRRICQRNTAPTSSSSNKDD